MFVAREFCSSVTLAGLSCASADERCFRITSNLFQKNGAADSSTPKRFRCVAGANWASKPVETWHAAHVGRQVELREVLSHLEAGASDEKSTLDSGRWREALAKQRAAKQVTARRCGVRDGSDWITVGSGWVSRERDGSEPIVAEPSEG